MAEVVAGRWEVDDQRSSWDYESLGVIETRSVEC